MKVNFSDYTKKYKDELFSLLEHREYNAELTLVAGLLLLVLLILKLIL